MIKIILILILLSLTGCYEQCDCKKEISKILEIEHHKIKNKERCDLIEQDCDGVDYTLFEIDDSDESLCLVYKTNRIPNDYIILHSTNGNWNNEIWAAWMVCKE